MSNMNIFCIKSNTIVDREKEAAQEQIAAWDNAKVLMY